MKTSLRTFFVGVLLLTSTYASASVAYKEGDVIGESEILGDATTSFFEAATSSRYGHVGLVMKGSDGWVVYEEHPPKAQVTPLHKFLSRSHGVYTVIRKAQPLTAEQLHAVRAAAQDMVRREVPYNYDQTSNGESLNCSEFVHTVFAAAHLVVGKAQTVGDLNLKTFHGYLWKLWKKDLPDTDLKDPVLTPASVMRSTGWNKIAGTVDPHVALTDKQLVAQWKKEFAIPGIALVWGVPPWRIERLANP